MPLSFLLILAFSPPAMRGSFFEGIGRPPSARCPAPRPARHRVVPRRGGDSARPTGWACGCAAAPSGGGDRRT